MLAVIFEVEFHPESEARYFELAGLLRAELETLDGFISVERFRSLADSRRYVSLSFWRDEAAIEAWHRHPKHRAAHAEGYGGVLKDFRIRVAEVIRDYTLESGRPPVESAAGTR